MSTSASSAGAVMSLRQLGVSFAGNPQPASSQICLELNPGSVLALVGESGSGKSVTALGALGLLDDSAQVTGSAVVRSKTQEIELVGAPRRVLNEVRGGLVGMIFQEPTTALDPLETVFFQIAEAVRAHRSRQQKLKRKQLRAQVLALLQRVGLGQGSVLERIAGAYPHQLSGGQLQRVCIALAMAGKPAVLIADEPTTALDVTVQAGILDLLRSLAQEGVAIWLITHDMGVVADVADMVAVMHRGQIVERGTAEEIFYHPTNPYTHKLLAAVPQAKSLRVRAALPAADAPDRADLGAPAPAEPTPAAASQVVVVSDLNVIYRNGRRTVHAVKDVSLHIAAGEILGLVGESGSGKSTIAATLTGLVPVASGSVQVCGVEIPGATRQQLLTARKATGVIYQNPASSLNPRRTVGAAIAEPMVIHGGYDSAQRRARVRELLEAVQLPAAMAARYPHEMSGGQRQRVAIARALALDPRLVIADEPTSALDVSVQAVVLDLLRNLQAELGFACLFVSHDLAVVDSLAQRTVVLNAGRVVETGDTAQVLAHPRQEYTRRLVAAVPVPDPHLQARRRQLRAA